MKNKDAKSLTPESKDPVTFADVLDLDLNEFSNKFKDSVAKERESVKNKTAQNVNFNKHVDIYSGYTVQEEPIIDDFTKPENDIALKNDSPIMRENTTQQILPYERKYHSLSKLQRDRLRKKMDAAGIPHRCANPKCKNKNNKSIKILIHHINGNELQCDGDDGTECGNLQYLCYSCHQLYGIKKRVYDLNPNDQIGIDPSKALSYESTVKTLARPRCLENIDKAIDDNGHHFCESVLNEAPEILTAGVSKIKFNEYYTQNTQKFGIDNARYHRFRIESYMCGNTENCSGIHVTRVNNVKPMVLISKEKIFLQGEYDKHIESIKKNNAIKNASNEALTPELSFEQYSEERSKLARHDFTKYSSLDDDPSD